MRSAVEEDGFVRPAQMDRQLPVSRSIAPGDQGGTTGRLDQLQYGVLAQLGIALEIEPRRQPVKHAAREHRDVDVRCLQAARRPWHTAGLDGAEGRTALAALSP